MRSVAGRQSGAGGDREKHAPVKEHKQKKATSKWQQEYSSTPENSSCSSEESVQRSVHKNGRYINPWPTFKPPSLGNVIKWSLFSKDNSRIPPKQELDVTLPVLKPDLELLNKPPDKGVRATWIGHATVLVQLDGCTVLTDPVFSCRCSPVQFAGPKRYRQVPCTVHDLPRCLDAVIISHNHYDHLDLNSVQALNARFGADLRWFVPLGLASWMHNNGCENVLQLDWWDENCLTGLPQVRFVFTPAQHWCKRTPLDDNKVLWGSWCIIGPENRFFFAGDTGYCSTFEQIGKKFGPFDLAAIPIGAYDPRWFMAPQHINPEEAVKVHKDILSRRSLAIHWGTFNLSNEYYLEPPEKLRTAMEESGLSKEEFLVLKHGETVHADAPSPPSPSPHTAL